MVKRSTIEREHREALLFQADPVKYIQNKSASQVRLASAGLKRMGITSAPQITPAVVSAKRPTPPSTMKFAPTLKLPAPVRAKPIRQVSKYLGKGKHTKDIYLQRYKIKTGMRGYKPTQNSRVSKFDIQFGKPGTNVAAIDRVLRMVKHIQMRDGSQKAFFITLNNGKGRSIGLKRLTTAQFIDELLVEMMALIEEYGADKVSEMQIDLTEVW